MSEWTKQRLAETIAKRTFKVKKYSPKLKVRERLDDPDEMAEVTLYLNGSIVEWLLTYHSEWRWIIFRAVELKSVHTMGDFESLCEEHIVEAP